MAAKKKTVDVAYEDPHDNFEPRVRYILRKLGSKDPDEDMALTGDYVPRARDAGLDPQIVASTVFILADQKRSGGYARPMTQSDPSAWGAEERPGRPGYYAVDPSGKIVAGPFSSRHLAEPHAQRTNGYIQFEPGTMVAPVTMVAAAAECPSVAPEESCGCTHPADGALSKPLRWHRSAAGEYYADCPLGKFQVAKQKSNMRQGVAGYALRLDRIEMASFQSVGEAKAYAGTYGSLVPTAAAGENVRFENAGKVTGRPVVGGKPIAEACLPWVRVTKDPEKFAACMAQARTIGPLSEAKQVNELLSPYLSTEDQEVYLVVVLDVHDELRGVTEVARGQRSKVMVDVADVLRPVILTGASSFWAVHQHPSGDPTPSPMDKRLTKSIADAARTACPDVKFKGHVVSGGKSYKLA